MGVQDISGGLPYMRRPCTVCPFRRDAPPGGFPACNYERLRDTSTGELGAPIFGCHTGVDGDEKACAGWLAVAGGESLAIRLALLQGRLSPAALTPGPDWPPLYSSYAEMAEAMGAPDGNSRWERGEGREGKLAGAGPREDGYA